MKVQANDCMSVAQYENTERSHFATISTVLPPRQTRSDMPCILRHCTIELGHIIPLYWWIVFRGKND